MLAVDLERLCTCCDHCQDRGLVSLDGFRGQWEGSLRDTEHVLERFRVVKGLPTSRWRGARFVFVWHCPLGLSLACSGPRGVGAFAGSPQRCPYELDRVCSWSRPFKRTSIAAQLDAYRSTSPCAEHGENTQAPGYPDAGGS